MDLVNIKFNADPFGFIRATHQVQRAANHAHASVARLQRATLRGFGGGSHGTSGGGATGGVSDLGDIFSAAGMAVQALLTPLQLAWGAMKALGLVTISTTAAFAAFSFNAVQAYSEVQALQRGLQAMMGSEKAAQDEWLRLAKVAQLPGLGLLNVAEGDLRLQAAGLSAMQAREAMMAFGNALATVGKGNADLEGVTLALSQILAKGRVLGQEVNQLAERVPQIRQIMLKAFGTTLGAEIEEMGISVEDFISLTVKELQKLPIVAGGVKNSIENIADAIIQAKAAWGRGIFESFGEGFEKGIDFLIKIAQSGMIEKIAKSWAEIFGGGDKNLFIKMIAILVVALERIPTLISMVQASFVLAIGQIVDWYNKLVPILNFAKLLNPATRFMGDLKPIDKATMGEKFMDNMGITDFMKDVDELIAKMSGVTQVVPPEDEASQNVTGVKRPLNKIADNTYLMVQQGREQLNLQKIALGGGNIAGKGITQVEMNKLSRRGRGTKLEQLIREIQQEAIGEFLVTNGWKVAMRAR